MTEKARDLTSESCSTPVLHHNLGILFHEESGKGLTHPFFILAINAFKEAAEDRGYDITFINHKISGPLSEHCLKCGLDGIFMVCIDFQDARAKELVTSGIPCITMDHVYKHVPAVLSDNENGIRMLVQYAIGRGHRRIAIIHGHNNSIVTRTRISQFKNTMAFHNLPVPDCYLRESRYHDIPLTRDHVLELLKLPEPPTCILLPDDMTYLGAQDAARELGLRIPEDISFAGYDGLPLTQALSPRLTTIRQSSERMGRVAAERLTALIEHPDTSPRMPSIFPVDLIEGETVCQLNA